MGEQAPVARWNPERYALFAEERAKPFFDLMALLDPVPGGEVVDLGCGTGELTALLHEYTGARRTLGLDSSPEMLDRTQAVARDGLCFELGDISQLRDEGRFDIVFANASLQWGPVHPRLLGRLAAALRHGGQLAVQVPANFDHPSHALAAELAGEPPFAERVGAAAQSPSPVLTPERYAVELHELGFSELHVRLQVYGHVLPSSEAVVDWTRGTTLLRYEAALGAELFEEFLARYRQRLREALGEKTPYLYTFNRILFRARLP